jgi:hypothetical protein
MITSDWSYTSEPTKPENETIHIFVKKVKNEWTGVEFDQVQKVEYKGEIYTGYKSNFDFMAEVFDKSYEAFQRGEYLEGHPIKVTVL